MHEILARLIGDQQQDRRTKTDINVSNIIAAYDFTLFEVIKM